MVLFLLNSLAQDHGAVSPRCRLESDELGYWGKKKEKKRKNVLVWLVCLWLVVSSCLSFSPLSTSSFARLLSLLRGLRPGTGACILLSLSRLPLDDLTMPPYSPHPLPPLTPLSGNINSCLAESKSWLWLVLFFFSSFLLLFFSLSYS